MTRFTDLVQSPSGHEEIAFALCEELGAAVPEGAEQRLAKLAASLPTDAEPLVELSELCAAVRDRYELRRSPLLLSRVLSRGGGHHDALTILAAAVARRARLEIGIVSDGDRLYLAHRRLGAPFIADLGRDEPIIDGRTLGLDLSWQCGHETAGLTLRRVASRSHETGDLATELAALALIMRLPLSGTARSAYEDRHRRLLARLN